MSPPYKGTPVFAVSPITQSPEEPCAKTVDQPPGKLVPNAVPSKSSYKTCEFKLKVAKRIAKKVIYLIK